MNRNEILEIINSNINLLRNALGTIYHGKTYAVISCNTVENFFKTKRGAEGFIKKNKDFSYYDDYMKELVCPHKNDEMIEILESELKDIKTDKYLWYNYLKKNMHSIYAYHQGENILYEAEKAGVTEDIMIYIKETIKDIEENCSMIVLEEKPKAEEVEEEIKEENKKIDKDILRSLDNIKETVKYLQWTIKGIYIEDNCIYANVINKYNVENNEGLYAGSDFSEEPTKVMYQLLLKEFNLKEITKTEQEQPQQSDSETTQNQENENAANNTINVNVTFNQEKNGIELHFTDKPSQEIREQIKMNGFRWSKYQKIWFAKDTDERREFLKSVGFSNSENNDNSTITVSEVEKNIQEIEYTEIDINDIENYTVPKELNERENNVSMFRRGDIDHTRELQKTLKSANDNVMELINIKGCTPYIEFKAKTTLQSFKKKYSELYIKILNHRANNPSWAVTGRGGLNISRYNKKQEQLTNMYQKSSQLIDNFNYKTEQFKRQIENKQERKLKAELENNLKSIEHIPEFKRTKIKINGNAVVTNVFNISNTDYVTSVTAHQLEGYSIIKNWGCFRVYDVEGKEIYNTKTTETLDTAKKYVLYLLQQKESA